MMTHPQTRLHGPLRWANTPGVIYPKELTPSRSGVNSENSKPFQIIPSWGITTEQAAIILVCSVSAALVMMKNKGVDHQLVALNARYPRYYWRKTQVIKIAGEKEPLVHKEEISGLLTIMEAAGALNVARSTIQRAIKSGALKALFLRIQSDKGPRRMCFIPAVDVATLSKKGEAGAH